MKKLSLFAVALALAANAVAAPNVTNVTQKGSLLIWPDIRVDNQGGGWNTLIRLQNDGTLDVDVKCYWMDGNKNRVDFIIPVTRNQAVWFDAASGRGTFQVNRFPTARANGLDNPFLVSKGATREVPLNSTDAASDDAQQGGAFFATPYLEGLLACWAVDNAASNQIKWNHLSGTATVYSAGGAYEYNAYAFFVPTGLDQEPVGVAGALNLNGVEYDSCPLYQIGQFTPEGVGARVPAGGLPLGALSVTGNRLAIAGCSLNLNQDYTPVWTKLQFDIWNEDEVKFTGAYECSDSWHETEFDETTDPAAIANAGGGIDSAASNFHFLTVGTYAARYRVQGIKSTQCEAPGRVTQGVGIVAVQSSSLELGDAVGTTLAAAGKFTGKIVWDPEGAVPEGGIR